MGIYSEYLDKNLDFPSLSKERKEQLAKISTLRGGRDIFVYAADLSEPSGKSSICYGDLQRVKDQIANLHNSQLDLIIETPGGLGEVAEDIVKLLRTRYDDVAAIIPGWTRSAGTLIAMACDDILMEPDSSLGPIDAQLHWQGKVFSAGELIEGFEKIKKEVESTQILNKAYIPILQGISPGELARAENAQDFSKHLVTEWLATYKFKGWSSHSSTGEPVTEEDKRERAEEIASQLRDHKRWLTHARSIKIPDLEGMRLKITDYSKNQELADAIRRYHILLQITFQSTNIYKVFETPNSQIYDYTNPVGLPQNQEANLAQVGMTCRKCGKVFKVQANFKKNQPIDPGHIPFPGNNKLNCPGCNAEIDLTAVRRDIEMKAKKRVIS